MRRRRRQRELQKTNRLIRKNNNYATAGNIFLYLSLPSLHHYDVKIPRTLTKVDEIFFFFLYSDMALRNSVLEEFACI